MPSIFICAIYVCMFLFTFLHDNLAKCLLFLCLFLHTGDSKSTLSNKSFDQQNAVQNTGLHRMTSSPQIIKPHPQTLSR